MRFEVELSDNQGKRKHAVEIEKTAGGYAFKLDERAMNADAVQVSPGTYSILIGGRSFVLHVTPTPDGKLKVQSGPHEYTASVVDPREWRSRRKGLQEAEGRQQIIAPMPGKVIRILVKEGDAVEMGQGLLVVEAMKMQNEIRSPKSGRVGTLQAKEGQTVNAGEVLAWVE
jgi:biotin carboxyl carrier protein